MVKVSRPFSTCRLMGLFWMVRWMFQFDQPDQLIKHENLCTFTHHTDRSGVWKCRPILISDFSLSGYRYLGDGGTDRREILHDGTCRSRTGFLSFWERCMPKSEILGLNVGRLTANISKTVSRSRYVLITLFRATNNLPRKAATFRVISVAAANKVNRSEEARKVEHAYNCWKCANAVYPKSSKSVYACGNYTLPKLARFLRHSVVSDAL